MNISNIFETMQSIQKLAKAGMTLELQEKIVELRELVVALKEENVQLKEALQELRQKHDRLTKADLCPKCKKPAWSLESSKPHPLMGELGVLEKTYKCTECGYSETRIDDGKNK